MRNCVVNESEFSIVSCEILCNYFKKGAKLKHNPMWVLWFQKWYFGHFPGWWLYYDIFQLGHFTMTISNISFFLGHFPGVKFLSFSNLLIFLWQIPAKSLSTVFQETFLGHFQHAQNAFILVAISQKISLPWKINNCNIYQIWGKNPCFCTKFKNCPMCFTLLNPIYGRQSRCTGSNHKGANVLYKFLGRKMIFLEIFMSLAGHSSVWSPNVATFPAQRKYIIWISCILGFSDMWNVLLNLFRRFLVKKLTKSWWDFLLSCLDLMFEFQVGISLDRGKSALV